MRIPLLGYLSSVIFVLSFVITCICLFTNDTRFDILPSLIQTLAVQTKQIIQYGPKRAKSNQENQEQNQDESRANASEEREGRVENISLIVYKLKFSQSVAIIIRKKEMLSIVKYQYISVSD